LLTGQSALENSGFKFPLRRITVNLAPADLRKDGAAFAPGHRSAVVSATTVHDTSSYDTRAAIRVAGSAHRLVGSDHPSCHPSAQSRAISSARHGGIIA
jgi:hypothetical protein